jgi:hypothetical protein
MTHEQFEYTVESYNTDPEGRPQQSDVAKVLAASPQAAALKVLQEELFIIGDAARLRARVRHTSISGVEKVTMLYSKLNRR